MEGAAGAAAGGGTDFSCLDEALISHILSFTSPGDVCRFSAVSTVFRSASEADAVWLKFLPPDYPEILSTSTPAVHFSSKKQLYFRLCDSIPVDDGKRRFWLEKSSGRKCYALRARELVIVWGDMPKVWRGTRLRKSRFAEVARFLGVRWIEIWCKFDMHMLSSDSTYAAFLKLKFHEDAQRCNYPMTPRVKLEGNACLYSASLLATERDRQTDQSNLELIKEKMNTLQGEVTSKFGWTWVEDPQIPLARTDGWMEIEIGEFSVDERGIGEVEMILTEVEPEHCGCGLTIGGVEIRPKK